MQSVRINMGRVSIFEKSLRFSHWTSTGPKNTFETMRKEVAINFKTTKNMSQYKEDMKRIDRLEDVFGVRLDVYDNDINKALGKELKEK